jgi:anti-sigma factor RsiW
MDCKECTDQLTAFLDAEVSAREAEQIRSHLNACKSCADEWVSLRDSKEFIEFHVHDLEPRPEAWNLVRARISESPVPSAFHFFALKRWRIALATTALALVSSGLGYLQYQQIQRKALDKYISAYIQERETRWQVKPAAVSNAQAGIDFGEASPFADNPFIEIKAVASDNPFRSEDR